MLVMSVNLKSIESGESSYSKKYQDHIPCSFAYKLVCDDDKFTELIVVFRGKSAVYEFIEAFLQKYQYCKKVIKKHFNKNLTRVKKKNNSNRVTSAGFLKDPLMMTMEK